MRRAVLAAYVALNAFPAMALAQAGAQGFYSAPSSGVQSSDVQAAIAAQAAQDAQNYAPQSAIPAPCPVLPQDTLTGSVGAATPCAPRPDATRPTVVQAAKVTTDNTAAWSVTWGRAFSSATPYVHAEPVTPNAQMPVDCIVYTATATGATGKCFQSTTTTLGGSLTAILGLIISPFVNAASGVDVRVIGRETTQ